MFQYEAYLNVRVHRKTHWRGNEKEKKIKPNQREREGRHVEWERSRKHNKNRKLVFPSQLMMMMKKCEETTCIAHENIKMFI